MEHPWPGNVRELRNLMERLAYLSAEDRIEAEDLAFILSPRGQTPLVADLSRSLADATDQFPGGVHSPADRAERRAT